MGKMSKDEANERIEKLKEFLKKWNYDYFIENKTGISEGARDKIKRELEDLEREFPDFKSWWANIERDPRLRLKIDGEIYEMTAALVHDPIELAEILGRDPVTLDWQSISHNIESKVVLITGAGGSIGSELCRQIAAVGPKELVLYEQSEYNLYAIQEELVESFPELELRCVLGDICDAALVAHIFKQHTPDAVFHAAAYKHVPLLEGQVREAVKNNILGTRNIVDAAVSCNAESFLLPPTKLTRHSDARSCDQSSRRHGSAGHRAAETVSADGALEATQGLQRGGCETICFARWQVADRLTVR